MRSFLTLLKNLSFLTKVNLREVYSDVRIVKNGLDFVKYEIKDDLDSLFVPDIMSFEDTVNTIIEQKCSVSRFGDGEFLLMKNKDIVFQDADPKLAKRLEEVLTCNLSNLLIGLPYSMCHSTYGQTAHNKNFNRLFWGENADWVLSLVKKNGENKKYADTGFTILPQGEARYNCLRSVWKDRDVTVICGDRVFKGIDFNVFDCAKSVEYLYAPTVNAFASYDEILNNALKIDKNRLVTIILGPTATVLAADLAKEGYQALDLGHLVKSYDGFCKNLEHTPEYLKKFFGKD